jgi:hypothetical protein
MPLGPAEEERFAADGVGHCVDPGLIDLADQVAGFGVPQAQRIVASARGEDLAVGRIGEAEDSAAMPKLGGAETLEAARREVVGLASEERRFPRSRIGLVCISRHHYT